VWLNSAANNFGGGTSTLGVGDGNALLIETASAAITIQSGGGNVAINPNSGNMTFSSGAVTITGFPSINFSAGAGLITNSSGAITIAPTSNTTNFGTAGAQTLATPSTMILSTAAGAIDLQPAGGIVNIGASGAQFIVAPAALTITAQNALTLTSNSTQINLNPAGGGGTVFINSNLELSTNTILTASGALSVESAGQLNLQSSAATNLNFQTQTYTASVESISGFVTMLVGDVATDFLVHRSS
jgi:hypothetical protein